MVCINKSDINRENTEKIKKYCQKNRISLAGETPYDPIVTKAMVAGKTVVEFDAGPAATEIKKLWKKVAPCLLQQ